MLVLLLPAWPACAGTSLEDPSAVWRDRAHALHLDEAPQWRRLLHIPPGARRSEIAVPAFFLSAPDTPSARTELDAALAAWFAPAALPGDADPRCRFPARLRWLQEQLALPAATDAPACPALRAWQREAQAQSVSMVMISGYFGNPASSFGHTLLKISGVADSPDARPLDPSLNFGADVPDDEPDVLYVLKGVFGGYEARFSAAPHEQRERRYARTEFRDLWEYELALDEAQRQRITDHLWELRSARFPYHFFDDNCAYRHGQIINVGLQRDLIPRPRLWFSPAELFERLAGARNDGHALVARIRFVPSSQRLLYARFAALEPSLARRVNALLDEPQADPDPALRDLPEADRGAVLDTLLAYYAYRLDGLDDDAAPADPAQLAARERARRAYAALPGHDDAGFAAAELPPPTAGTAPMLGALGAQHDGDRTRVELRYAPYFQDLVGRHIDDSHELRVFDAIARADDAGLRLDQLDFIGLRNLRPAPGIAGENRLSWQARAGLRRSAPDRGGDARGRLRAQAEAGAGQALHGPAGSLAYAMLDLTSTPGETPLAAGALAGLLGGGAAWRVHLQWSGQYDLRREDWRSRVEAQLRLSVARQLELRGAWQRAAERSAFSLTLARYW